MEINSNMVPRDYSGVQDPIASSEVDKQVEFPQTPNVQIPSPTDYGNLLQQDPEKEGYAKFLRSLRDERDANILASWQHSVKSNPELVSEYQRVARELDVPEELAENRIDVLRNILKERVLERDQILKNYPNLADHLQNVSFAKISHDQLENLKRVEEAVQANARKSDIARAWQFLTEDIPSAYNLAEQLATLSAQEAEIARRVDAAGIMRPEDRDELQRITSEREALAPQMTTTSDIGVTGLHMAQIFAEGAKYGIAGAGIGAALAAPTAGTALPITGPVGLSLGFTAGAFKKGFEIYFHEDMAEMLRRGVPVQDARVYARMSGALQAAVESVSPLGAGKALGFVGRNVGKKALGKALNEMFMPVTRVRAWKEFSSTAVKDWGKEVTEEIVQDLVKSAFVNLADTKTELTQDQIIDSIKQTFVQSALVSAFFVPMAPGAKLFFDLQTMGSSARGIQLAEGIRAATVDNEVKRRNPVLYAGFLKAQFENTDAETVYIDSKELQAAWSRGINSALDEAAKAAGVPVEQLTGRNVVISKFMADMKERAPTFMAALEKTASNEPFVSVPASEYFTFVDETPIGRALAQHITFDVKHLTPSQFAKMEQRKKEMVEEAKAAITKQRQAAAVWESERDQIEKNVFEKLNQIGGFTTRDERKSAASILSAMSVVIADKETREGRPMSPMQAFDKFYGNYKIKRAATGQTAELRREGAAPQPAPTPAPAPAAPATAGVPAETGAAYASVMQALQQAMPNLSMEELEAQSLQQVEQIARTAGLPEESVQTLLQNVQAMQAARQQTAPAPEAQPQVAAEPAPAPEVAPAPEAAPDIDNLDKPMSEEFVPEADAAVERGRAAQIDNLGRKLQAAGFVDVKVGQLENLMAASDIKTVDWNDLVGSIVFPTLGDRTAACATYRGIDSSEIKVEVPLLGGTLFSFRLDNIKHGIGWANRGESIKSAKEAKIEGGAAYMLVAVGAPDMHKSNTTVAWSYYRTLLAYIRDKRVAEDAIPKLNALIRGGGTKGQMPDKVAADVQTFPGLENEAATEQWLDSVTFDTRSWLMESIYGSTVAQKIGAPDVQAVLDATVETKMGVSSYRWGDMVSVIKVDVDNTFTELGTQGTTPHPDFPIGIRGTLVGKLKVPINYEVLYKDWLNDVFEAKKKEGVAEERIALWRAWQLAMPPLRVDASLAQRMNALEHGRLEGHRQARLAVEFALDNWKTSDDLKTKGGISPTELEKAIKRSPARASLTQYTASQIKKLIKEKLMKVYQLGQDSAIWFAIKTYNPAAEYGMEGTGLTDNEKVLVSVVNNELGARGIGGPAVLLKALQEGATALDCFAVQSSKYPDGFLPTLYSAFGFEVVGKAPFAPEYYTDAQIADLKKYWTSTGWDQQKYGWPSVVVMKWKGTDKDRENIVRRYLESGLAGLLSGGDRNAAEAGWDKLSSDARRAAAENSRANAGSAAGTQGSSSGGSMASRAYELAADIAGLSDEAATNLGIGIGERDAVRRIVGERKRDQRRKLQAGNLTTQPQRSLAATHYAPDGSPLNLVVTHSINSKNLRESIKAGALPMPSMAVVRADLDNHGNFNFGEVSLLSSAGLVDPETGTHVFDADAYTATYPTLEPMVDPKDLLGLVEDLWPTYENPSIAKYSAMFQPNEYFGYKSNYNWLEQLTQYEDADLAFLDHGHHPALITKFLISRGRLKPEDFKYTSLVSYAQAFYEEVGLPLSYSGDTGHFHYKKDADGNDQIVYNLNADYARRGAYQYWFEKWFAANKFTELGKKRGIKGPDGKLVEATPQAIAEYMLRRNPNVQMQQGIEGVLGDRSGRAALALKFTSMDQIRAARHRLVEAVADEADFTKWYKTADATEKHLRAYMTSRSGEAQMKLNEPNYVPTKEDYYGSILPGNADLNVQPMLFRALYHLRYANPDNLIISDLVGAMNSSTNVKDPDTKKKKFGIVFETVISPEHQAKFLEQFKELLRLHQNMATDLFEVKPARAVAMGEFVAAIMPLDAKEETIDAAKSAGLKVYYYDNVLGRKSKKNRADAIMRAATEIHTEERRVLFAEDKADNGDMDARAEIDLDLDEILLNENADVSAWFHELVHGYQNMLFTAAGKADAPAWVIKEVEFLLDHFGIGRGLPFENRLALWNAMSFQQQEPHWELLAYQSEEYIATGKAPSIALAKVFEGIRRFVKRAYQHVRDVLNPTYRDKYGTDLPGLTPEVTGFFERMLATEQEIREAQWVHDMVPMFDEKNMPMTPEEMNAYLAMDDDATREAIKEMDAIRLREMELLRKAPGKALAEQHRKARKIRETIREQVARKVRMLPVYRVMHYLRTGQIRMDGAPDVPGSVDARLDYDIVKAMFPNQMGEADREAFLRQFGTGTRSMLKRGGVDPRDIASLFGFKDATEMVFAIANAVDETEAIETQTDERAKAEHSDVFDPEKMEQAVLKALNNKFRTQFIAAELRWLDRARLEAKEYIDVAKEAAKQILSRKTLRDINPRNFKLAEARARREATAAWKKGDAKETLEAKKRELLYHYMVKEAVEIRSEISKAKELFKKLFRPEKRIAKTRDFFVVSAGRSLLAAHGFESSDKKPSEYLEYIREINSRLASDLESIFYRAEHTRINYKDMTVEDFMGLRDAVNALWERAKRDRQIRINGQLEQRSKGIRLLNQRMQEIGMPAPGKAPGESQGLSTLQKTMHHIRIGMAKLTMVEAYARAFDGGDNGPFHTYIWRPIRTAWDNYLAARREILGKVHKIVRSLEFKRIEIKADPATEFAYTFGPANGGFGEAEVMGSLQHSGNEQQLANNLAGRGWCPRKADGTVDPARYWTFIMRVVKEGKITEAHLDAIQALWDLNELLKADIKRVFYEINGYPMTEIVAKSFTVTFPDGRTKTYRGGYMPAKMDSYMVPMARGFEELDILDQNFRSQVAKANDGFTKERKKQNDQPLDMDIRLILKHVNDVVRYVHMQIPIRDVASILRDPEFGKVADRFDPGMRMDTLMPWLVGTAHAVTQGPGFWKPLDSFVTTVRRRTTQNAFFGNLRVAMQQVTGFFPALVAMNPQLKAAPDAGLTESAVAAIRRLMVNVRYLRTGWAMWIKDIPNQNKFITESSLYMKNLYDDSTIELTNEINDLILKPSLYNKAQSFAAKHALILQRIAQNCVNSVTWLGAFNAAMETLPADMDSEAKRQEAVYRADEVVRLSQGSKEAVDIPQYQRVGPYGQIAIMFSGYYNAMANLQASEYIRTVREMGWSKGAIPQLFFAWMFAQFVPSLIGDAISAVWGGEFDDDDGDGYWDEVLSWLLGSQMRAATATIPAVGPNIMAGVNLFNEKPYDDRMMTSPAISALEAATRGALQTPYKLFKGEDLVGRDVRDVFTLIALMSGIPADWLGKGIGYAVDVERGAIRPYMDADYLRGLMTGAASPGTRR